MWARLPRGGICTNRLRVGAEFIKPMLMIPFIVQNLNAIGQSDDGLINPSVISTLWAFLRAIACNLFKNRYPTAWVARAGGLSPYSPTLQGVGSDRPMLVARAGGLSPYSPTLQGVGSYRPLQPGDLGGSSLSPFRIQGQLSRIDLSVAPWFPPSLWTRGIFLRFEPPQPGSLGPTQSFPLALFLPKNTPMKPRLSGSRRSEWRFQRAILAPFSCIKLWSAVPDPATKQTPNYALFSFLKENFRRNIIFFEGKKNSFFSV